MLIYDKTDKRIYTMAEEKTTKAVLKMGIPVTMGTNRYERNGSIVFCEKHITIIVGM